MTTEKTWYARLALATLDGLLCPLTLAKGAWQIRREIHEAETQENKIGMAIGILYFLMCVLAVASAIGCLAFVLMLLPLIVDARAAYWVSGAMSVVYTILAIIVGVTRFGDYSEKKERGEEIVSIGIRRVV